MGMTAPQALRAIALAPGFADEFTPITRRPRIALVGHSAHARFFGAERSLLDILRAIDQSRFRVSCILPTRTNDYLREVQKYTSSIVVFPYKWWKSGTPVDRVGVAGFEAAFRKLEADIVHVNTVTLMDPLIAARNLGIPGILHARELVDRNERLAEMLGGPPDALLPLLRESADFVIGNSEATRRLYGGCGGFRLYNCVDAELFSIAQRPRGGRLRAGIISSNGAAKGLADVVALARLARRQRNIEFVIIGPDNAYVRSLRGATGDAALPANLHFAGYTATSAEAIAQIDVLLSLSYAAEAFGRTIAEAMAAGRPVIAYDWGATGELIDHGKNGFLLPYRDYAKALPLLEELAARSELRARMGALGRAMALQRFAPDVFARQLNAIYPQVLRSWAESRALS
jgi:glycosyltransferase involved in cell wall biosynthesis